MGESDAGGTICGHEVKLRRILCRPASVRFAVTRPAHPTDRLLGLLTFVVLVIGGCVAENYRGHYLWRKYRKQWEAKGEQFDLGYTNFPSADTPKDPASDVLTALRRCDAVLDEIRAASIRSFSVFPVHYEEHYQALLLHLAALKYCGQIVRLRTLALRRRDTGSPNSMNKLGFFVIADFREMARIDFGL